MASTSYTRLHRVNLPRKCVCDYNAHPEVIKQRLLRPVYAVLSLLQLQIHIVYTSLAFPPLVPS